jgi:hypothetical protein
VFEVVEDYEGEPQFWAKMDSYLDKNKTLFGAYKQKENLDE